ncbi:MAG TPA: hypothetical protein VMZ71_14550 [Gemmataceae bacterium]|nr:hypothetical protein [Gemmataceae bacterium]
MGDPPPVDDVSDEDDEAIRGWTGCAVVAVSVGMAIASPFVDSLLLPLVAVPVAATGSLVGFVARGSGAGRAAAAAGLLAVFLSAGAVLFVYGRAMAGLGLAG